MNAYECLVDYAEKNNLEVIEKNFKSAAKGLCKGNKIGISQSLSTSEKRCVLAEEITHSMLTVGDILDLRSPLALQQECAARRAAYELLVPVIVLLNAYIQCGSVYDLPDKLDVTPEFLQEALDYYAGKHNSLQIGEYTIYFSPFYVEANY